MLRVLFILFFTFACGNLFADSKKPARPCVKNIHRLVERDVRKAARYFYDKYIGVEAKIDLPVSLQRVESFEDFPVIEVIHDDQVITTNGAVIFKDRETGIRELIEISKRSKTELGWVYVPRYQVWINVSVRVENTSIEFDDNLLPYLPLISETLELVHIHPLKGKTGCPREYLILPSYNDLVSARSLNAVVDRARHGFGIYTSTIVSPFGTTVIHFNPKLVDQFFSATYRTDLKRKIVAPTKLQAAIKRLSLIESESEATIAKSDEVVRPFRFEFTSADDFK